jgi:DNA polymerase
MNIWYPALDDTEEGSSYSFGYGKRKAFIYGARLQENLVQGLARIVIADQILEMEKHGIQTVGSTHDEILCIVRRGEAKVKLAEMIEIMSTPPSWAPDLPLDAEGGFAKEYSK